MEYEIAYVSSAIFVNRRLNDVIPRKTRVGHADARTPKDEREQLIELKSRAVAWYVFVILSLGGIFVTIHAGANEIGLGFVVLLSFVVAEITNYAMRIYFYRRGF